MNQKRHSDNNNRPCCSKLSKFSTDYDFNLMGNDGNEDVLSPAHEEQPRCSKSLNHVETYNASGLKLTMHGNMFQIKLLTLFLWRATRKKFAFKLATEMTAAEKFDDLVLRYEKPNDTGANDIFYRVLQAKHKQNGNEKIKYSDLLNSDGGDFSLLKYFDSFLKIKHKSENGIDDFQKGKVEEYVLYTNIGLDDDLESIEKIQIDNDKDFGVECDKSKRFKLKISDKNSDLYKLLSAVASMESRMNLPRR
jgi:hypothetical protein